ncbi:MAG: phosphoglycerate kinase [Leptospiraceae bacterium]|nr:phosphoglycerate kinase [Leptospiraceae bacterium]MDW8307392.1 phosphoglycerate kinase [Leptospiraceae bacterium]
MSTRLPSLEALKAQGKKILVRVDFNVPLDKDTGEISDDTRIVASLPTLEYLLQANAALVLVSHLGRPKGADKSLSLAKVAEKLKAYLKKTPIFFVPDIVGGEAQQKKAELKAGEILVLENVRFHEEETSKDEKVRHAFAQKLCQGLDAYVNDAFGAAHRAHASIYECAKILPCYAGFLLKKEIEVLDQILTRAERPFVAVIGGAKISTKISVLENLLPKVDSLLIGGAMAYTFLKSRAIEIGNSMVENEFLSQAFQIMDKASFLQKDLLLPEDHIVANEFSAKAKAKKTNDKNIPPLYMGMDIGPKTIDRYTAIIKKAKTVLWNGPMGVFEMERFAKGTIAIAKAMAKVKGTTVVGGGDSAYAVKMAKVAHKMTHVSTGGGATLEYLEGKKLPGVEVLLQTS